MPFDCDIIVIGAGIAGASLAAELAQHYTVIISEQESMAGYHATGRSAATYVPSYGPAAIRTLTKASKSFLKSPPEGFCEGTILKPRGELMLLTKKDEHYIEQALELGLQQITIDQAHAMVPILKPDYLYSAMYDDKAEDIDVDILLQGYLRKFRAQGGSVLLNGKVSEITPVEDGWQLKNSYGIIKTKIVVNAAGAWADQVAEQAGLGGIGITPKRRSAALIKIPAEWNIYDWPLTFAAGETFYFRPMSGDLMISPADETPVEPHDVWADDYLIAEAVEHFHAATTYEVRRLGNSWAGMRSFAADGNPVIGFDPRQPGFFWLAGQGGYGIQTAPAIAKLACQLISGNTPDQEMTTILDDISPARFIT